MLQSVGKSLTFRGTVFEASEVMKSHKCADPVCDTQLWKVRKHQCQKVSNVLIQVRHELDLARLRLTKLQSELKSRGINPTVKKTYSNSFQSNTNR